MSDRITAAVKCRPNRPPSHRLNTLSIQLQWTLSIQCRTTSKTLNKQSTIFKLYITSMYKLSLHIICTRSFIKLSVPGGKYRTDFRYFRYLIVDIRYFSVLRIPTSVSVFSKYRISLRYFGIPTQDYCVSAVFAVECRLTGVRQTSVRLSRSCIVSTAEYIVNYIVNFFLRTVAPSC